VIRAGGQGERGASKAPELEEEEARIPVPVPAGGGGPPRGPPGPPGPHRPFDVVRGELLSVRLERGPLDAAELGALIDAFRAEAGASPGERRMLADILLEPGGKPLLLWRAAGPEEATAGLPAILVEALDLKRPPWPLGLLRGLRAALGRLRG
jgi:hypothetical protein